MILENLSQRERKILLATMTVAVACLLFNLIIYPAIKRWGTLGEKINLQEKELVRLTAALRMKERVEERYKQFEETIKPQGSDEEEMAKLLQQLESLTREVGLTVTNIKPLPLEDKKIYKRYAVSIESEGAIQQIGRFLYNIQRSPQLLKVQRLELNASSTTNLLKSDFLITRILASKG